jgi:hypothetical protein
MTTKNRRTGRMPPFIPVMRATMSTPAWRAMSYGARLLNIELRGKLRNRDFANNGKIYLSDRDAAAALGTKSTRSIVRWYAENEHYGFLRQTRGGFLGADGRGIAAQYRFTEFAYGPEPPTRDFEKWDGELFRYSPRRSKKQNPVSLGDTPRVPGGHILNSKKQGTVRVPGGHKVETPTRVPGGHTSRIAISPALSGAGEGEQGSSTARAPVQAGDAGSSPAPVSKPDPLRGPDGELTTMVLDIVTAQLDELEQRSAPHGRFPNGGEPLSSLRVRNLAEWREDQAYRIYSPTDIAAGKLDAALRARLRKEVSPTHVEIEFKRVMAAAR